MMMERSLSFLLSCLFLGIAVATRDSNKAPMVRVRRGVINVKQQQADELHRLTAEFGEGGLRALDEDMADMLGGDMSFSYEGMSMSMSMSMDMSFSYVEPSKAKKGKSRR